MTARVADEPMENTGKKYARHTVGDDRVMYVDGRRKPSPFRSLTFDDAVAIRKGSDDGLTNSQLARKYDVSTMTISRIVRSIIYVER